MGVLHIVAFEAPCWLMYISEPLMEVVHKWTIVHRTPSLHTSHLKPPGRLRAPRCMPRCVSRLSDFRWVPAEQIFAACFRKSQLAERLPFRRQLRTRGPEEKSFFLCYTSITPLTPPYIAVTCLVSDPTGPVTRKFQAWAAEVRFAYCTFTEELRPPSRSCGTLSRSPS